MTPLWDRLNDYAAHIRGKFQDNFTEYDEPAMADLFLKIGMTGSGTQIK